ncbi:MAG: class I SAM-dependent methyltransferase [Deltaproteobacteria bacterium]|jgi:16S rRNA (guanine1516-N2)-methyltransferase|nr:class I SAM-dependent methyltransferase [Deltaproteobacteria bacterium]
MVTHNNRSLSIAIRPAATELYDKAMDLSTKLSIPLIQRETKEYEFLLICSADGLALQQNGKKGLGPIMISFTSPAMTYRIKHGGGRKQALARAVGLKKGWQPTVIDATGGLGRDGFILACLGCRVHMLERSPVLAVMLEDALQRASQSEFTAEIISNRLQFTHADSSIFLQNLLPEDFPDIIYLDPMYPKRTKSSLVKKEMRILRGLTGDDQDTAALLDMALTRVRNRVVIKRPRLAPVLSSLMPSHQITGKSSRFDVYLI